MVKGLELGTGQKMKLVRKLLVKQAPNLTNLELNSVATERELFPKHAPVPKLFSLISLKLGEGNSSSLIKEIVDAAPNLQRCTGNWSMKEIEFLLPRLHILKGLVLSPEPSDLDALEELTKLKLQLKYFEMNYNNINLEGELVNSDAHKVVLAKFDRINSKILSSNRVTLEKIKLTPYSWIDNLIEWPEMLNVRKLRISGDNAGGKLKFPSFKISEKFPNVYTICIINSCSSDYFFRNDGVQSCGLLNDVASSVKLLRIDGYFADTFSCYSKTFPNVQLLFLNQVEQFQRVAPAIWNMKKLKSLKLQFCDCLTSQIDAGFTGMETNICGLLRNSGRGTMEVGAREKFQVNLSILNLTELEELHLFQGFQQEIGEGEAYDDYDEKDKPSFVSLTYAFNLMPQLRVFS